LYLKPLRNKHETQKRKQFHAMWKIKQAKAQKYGGCMKGRDGTYNGTDIVSGLCIIMSRRKGRV